MYKESVESRKKQWSYFSVHGPGQRTYYKKQGSGVLP
jgi:hypothetical protein